MKNRKLKNAFWINKAICKIVSCVFNAKACSLGIILSFSYLKALKTAKWKEMLSKNVNF